MRIVEVTGGVDTHADNHVAAAIDHNGGLLGVELFPADETGFEQLLAWLVGFGPVEQVGVEGTGSWGVELGQVPPRSRGGGGGGGSSQPSDPTQTGKVGSD